MILMSKRIRKEPPSKKSLNPLFYQRALDALHLKAGFSLHRSLRLRTAQDPKTKIQMRRKKIAKKTLKRTLTSLVSSQMILKSQCLDRK